MGFEITLFCLWFIVGLMALIIKPTRLDYALMWVVLLAQLLAKVFQ